MPRLTLSLAVLFALHLAPRAAAQEGMPSAAEMQAMQERMMAAMMPGPHHKVLERYVGDWNVTVKVWFGGPGSAAVTTQGRAKMRMIMDGRFLMEELEYTMNLPGPNGIEEKRAESLVLTGYDNFRQQYVTTIINNMNTHVLTFTGPPDPAGKVFRAFGEMDEPSLNVIGRMVKTVTTIEGPDKHTIEVIDLHPGDDYKVLEFTYERAK